MLVPETFSTERLVLRRPKASDATAVFAYGSDPEVAKFADWPRLVRVEDAAAALDNAAQRWEAGVEYSWRVTVKPDDTAVGGVACSLDGHRAELGFLLSRSLWGRGYATEAARVVFEWLRSLPKVVRIQATTDVDNVASARVLEKLGMSREAILHRWSRRPNFPGQPVRDALLYSWVREAYRR
jgi:RimJ/RimL family protein N-acetyltransferase